MGKQKIKTENNGGQKKIVKKMVHIISPTHKPLVSGPADSAIQAVKDPFHYYKERGEKKEIIGLLTEIIRY